MSLPKFEYMAPQSEEEAVALLCEYGDDAMVIAGGMTAVILLRERLARPKVLVSLSEIPALGQIKVNGEARIGAMATHAQISRSAALVDFASLICRACGSVGSPGIRNMGTLGGSVSHGDWASDSAPALLALGASAEIVGPNGKRTVPLESFFLGVFETVLEEGEILTTLSIPPAPASRQTRFKKYTCTSVEAYAAVATAVDFDSEGICSEVRIGLGSVAPMPIRATRAETLLRGQRLTPALIADASVAAAAETDPPSDGQGTSNYRREMTQVWVRRLLEDSLKG